MKSFNLIVVILILMLTSCKNEKTIDVISDLNAIENGLLPSILVKGDSIKNFNLFERMEHYKVPGVSIAIVENGTIKWAKGYGIANTNNGSKVDTNTLFQAGSISKPLAALSALKLVENGSIWRYSGGGYTVMEKMVEDVSGLPQQTWQNIVWKFNTS